MTYELLIYRIAHQLLEEKAKQRKNEVKEKGGTQERIWGKDKGKFKRENKEAKKKRKSLSVNTFTSLLLKNKRP